MAVEYTGSSGLEVTAQLPSSSNTGTSEKDKFSVNGKSYSQDEDQANVHAAISEFSQGAMQPSSLSQTDNSDRQTSLTSSSPKPQTNLLAETSFSAPQPKLLPEAEPSATPQNNQSAHVNVVIEPSQVNSDEDSPLIVNNEKPANKIAVLLRKLSPCEYSVIGGAVGTAIGSGGAIKLMIDITSPAMVIPNMVFAFALVIGCISIFMFIGFGFGVFVRDPP